MEFTKLIEIIFNKVPFGKMMYTTLLTLVLYLLTPASWLDLVPRNLPFGAESLTMLILTFAISYALVDLTVLVFGWSGSSLGDLIENRKSRRERKKAERIFQSLNTEELSIIFTFITSDFGAQELDKLDPTIIRLIKKGVLQAQNNYSWVDLDEKYHDLITDYYLSRHH